jgi:phosphonate transport system substrate-binding protein
MKMLLRWLLILLGLNALIIQPATAMEPLRIGLTPTFLNERHALIAEWRTYLERKLKLPVEFVLRDSYKETLTMLRQKRIDVAWLCDCPHVTDNPEFSLLATPLFQGRPYYRSYLIVPEEDATTRGMADLEGKVFAYTDPHSNFGYLFPRYEIRMLGEDPDNYFRRTFFTHSQRKAIEAVAVGVADAASVNSYIWETMHLLAPVLTGRTRIVTRSDEFGFPPFVTGKDFSRKRFRHLQQALFDMSDDAAGKAVLEKMNLDGFVPPRAETYRKLQETVRFMQNE